MIWVHSDAVPQFSHYDVPTWVHSDAVPQFSHYDVPTWVHSDAVPQFSHYDVPTWVHSDAVPQLARVLNTHHKTANQMERQSLLLKLPSVY